MKYLAFIWRVLRRLVWETATDNTTGLAAQMAYLLLFALAPGLLFLWHLLGLFGTDPTKLRRMFLFLKSCRVLRKSLCPWRSRFGAGSHPYARHSPLLPW